MKRISSARILVLAALAVAVEGRHHLVSPTFNYSQPNVSHVDRRHRRLDENQVELDGYYVLKFDGCVSLNLLDQEMIDNYVYGSAQSLQSTKDYVIVDAVNTVTGEGLKLATDISTYLSSLLLYQFDQESAYCEVCEDAYQSCQYWQQTAYQSVYSNSNSKNNNNGRRWLEQDFDNEFVDCETCQSRCFSANSHYYQQNNNDNQNQQQLSLDDALAWIDEVGQCQELSSDNGYNVYTQVNNNNQNYPAYMEENLYAGFMCNEDGTGLEMGVFDNEECTQRSTSQEKTFLSYIAQGSLPYAYYKMTKTTMESLITDCFYCNATTEYQNPFDEQQQNQNEQEDDNNDYEATDANEYCQALVQQDTIVSVGENAVCGTDEEDHDVDENGNPWGQYYNEYYGWYNYDINDSADMSQVCRAIQGMNGSYSTSLQQNKNANLYDYSNSNGATCLRQATPMENIIEWGKTKWKMSPGSIVGISVAACIMVSATLYAIYNIVLFLCSCRYREVNMNSDKTISLLTDDDVDGENERIGVCQMDTEDDKDDDTDDALSTKNHIVHTDAVACTQVYATGCKEDTV